MEKRAVALGAAFAFLWAAGDAWGYQEVAVKNGGSVAGVVRFGGSPPPPKELPITRDVEKCGKGPKVFREVGLSKSGGLRNAVVSIADIQKGKPLDKNPKRAPVLDQRECWFHPRVLIVPAGGTLLLRNTDRILHNFHAISDNPKQKPLNIAHPKFRKEIKLRKIRHPGLLKVNCDIHEWMRGWIVAAEHPYHAVTDAEGRFLLKDVPPGTYKVKVWHETLGTQTRSVTVRPNEKASLELTFR
ncbi:MAG: carboxypeptidase regulatory-like domain-containing protein [Nitrospinota bacterium]